MSRSILKLADDVWAGRDVIGSVFQFPTARPEEVADCVMMAVGFAHAYAIDRDDGITLFDTGSVISATDLHHGIRGWSTKPVTHAVYSHGHIDHVFGLGPFDEEAQQRGWAPPIVVAQENVPARFDRYRLTRGYNTIINRRQFRIPSLEWPASYRYPDVTYRDTTQVGPLELHHHQGETDDHSVGWLPDRRVLFAGDLFLWVSPNAGNPQKVQRYPREWAQALRWMASLDAELLLSGHGVPVAGAKNVREVLTNTARYLESLIEQTLELLNAGATLNDTIHQVQVPADLADLPYLQPFYDEPEFIVRTIWRRYGGWHDGDPAHLKPAPDAALARELAALCGGADVLAARASQLAEQGDLRLAAHLAQLAGEAAPTDRRVHLARATVFAQRAQAEPSTMSQGIFAWAAAQSRAVLSGRDVLDELVQPTPHDGRSII